MTRGLGACTRAESRPQRLFVLNHQGLEGPAVRTAFLPGRPYAVSWRIRALHRRLAVLRNVRTTAAADAADAKLVPMESALPEDASPHPGTLLDLEIPGTAGGPERTASECRKLLSRMGFRLIRAILTAGPMQIVGAVPA